MSRLLLVSNRLPVTFHVENGHLNVVRSPGGLATGLSGPHQQSGGEWIGFPGDVSGLTPEQREQLERGLTDLRAVPVYLTHEQVRGYYESFSNRVLWPLFHYLLDHVPVGAFDWQVYREVNQLFADEVARRYRPGDVIWVHDYQLCLVPGMLRERLPDARIGFFLHIPFPSSEVIQALPWRDELLRGMLGADLIGFHTYRYVRHFANALLRLLGAMPEIQRVTFEGREVRFGAYPMGIDAAAWAREAANPDIESEAKRLKEEARGRKIALGIDRLDYTKGIRRRLMAVERLFQRDPSLVEKLSVIQVAVPSRTSIGDYAEYGREVDEVVARINGQFATTSWVPIHYLYRAFSQRDLAALYRAADVMLVTPLRDGMNLVAKEFVASRVDEQGVLILSELAGAAAELGEALMVNPYDVDGIGEAILRSMSMEPLEAQIRMHALRERVMRADVHNWVKTFLSDLDAIPRVERARSLRVSPDTTLAEVRQRICAAPKRVFLLDYDGTLIPFGAMPDLVAPDKRLRQLIAGLAELPSTVVHLVSGRTRVTLEEWFGDLPIGLHAEHGLWSRHAGSGQWSAALQLPTDWKEKVRPMLESYVQRTPGTFIEEKSATMVWHHRMADPEFGQLQAKELFLILREGLSNTPVEILSGDMVIEVRPHGVNKGLVVPAVLKDSGDGALVVALGDDRTDEDLFAALGPTGIGMHVGSRESVAPYRLRNPMAARRFLEQVIADCAGKSA